LNGIQYTGGTAAAHAPDEVTSMTTIAHSQDSTQAAYGMAPRLLLASLLLAAGAVHLAMAPIHASNSTIEAAGFAVAGWAQILLAFAVLVRPGQPVLGSTIIVNAAIIVGYIISRTAGLPFGDQSWVADDVQGIDLMVTIFEAVLIAGALVLLAWPRFGMIEAEGGRPSFEALAIGSAIPLLVLVATSVALADPDLATHGHSGGDDGALVTAGGHGHDGGSVVSSDQAVALADNRCDLAFNPAAYWRETTLAGIDTIMGGELTAAGHGGTSPVAGSPELDKLTALHTTVEGEVGDAQVVLALSKVTDDVYDNWLRWLGASGMANHAHEGNAAAPDDTTMGGHLGPQPWHAMTDQTQCDQLATELQLARDTALKYATVADAKADGWRQITPYVPGIAAHFMNFSLVDDTFEIDKPEMILYDGTGDDARVVGLSYYIRHEGEAEPTQGFTGVNDHYHRHIGLCVNASGVIGDSTTTEEECTAMGGRKAMGGNGWMSHAWVVPGCESPWGVFSGATPVLDGKLFENSGQNEGGCLGSGVRARYDFTPGAVENTPTEVGGEVELAVGN
jgi:hypothetical protein